MGLETILITLVVSVAVVIAAFIAVYVSSLGNYPPYQDKLQTVDPNWPYPNWPFPTDNKP